MRLLIKSANKALWSLCGPSLKFRIPLLTREVLRRVVSSRKSMCRPLAEVLMGIADIHQEYRLWSWKSAMNIVYLGPEVYCLHPTSGECRKWDLREIECMIVGC